MEVIWIVIVIIGWLISAMSKTNQQAKNAQQKGRQQARPAPQRQAASQASRQQAGPVRQAPARPMQPQARPSVAAVPQPVKPAEPAPRPMEAHIHTPQMDLEGQGTEGMDCCHDYMLSDRTEEADFLPLTEETDTDRARALLQGVIYSEILGRRPVKRYGRKQPQA